MTDILTPDELKTLMMAAFHGTPGMHLTEAEIDRVYTWACQVRIDAEMLAAVLRREVLITVPIDNGDLLFSLRRPAVHG